jgi:hypothetical protein
LLEGELGSNAIHPEGRVRVYGSLAAADAGAGGTLASDADGAAKGLDDGAARDAAGEDDPQALVASATAMSAHQ